MARPLHLSVGAAGAALLISMVPQFEGMILRGYTDPIGIVTACAGHTKTAVLGRPYTRAECERLLVEDLAEHAEGVLRCTPVLKGQTYRLAAAVSFTYNVGVANYCDSATARRFNAGDYVGACRAMNESDSGRKQWVYGRLPDGTLVELPGLVTRRAAERAVCEGRIGDDESTVERDGGRVGAANSRVRRYSRRRLLHGKYHLFRVRGRRAAARYRMGRVHAPGHAAR